MSEDAAAAAAAPVEETAVAAPMDDTADDAAIEELRARVRAMEEEELEEAKRMNELSGAHAPSNPVGSGSGSASKAFATAEQSAEQDARSVHVAQVDYSVTEDELLALFVACGPVERVTILKDKFSGQPKGFGYIMFESADSVENAMILNDTEFKGRTLKVTPKRTNIPGFNRGGRGGRGGRGRGGPRGGFAGSYESSTGYGPMRGGRGGGRGRGAPRGGGYHPYQY